MRIDAQADRILNHFYRATSFTAPANVYASLLTAVTALKAGTVTEASFAGYARIVAAFAAPAADLNGRRIANSGALTFGVKTDAGSVDAIAVGIHDALSGGNMFDIVFLDADDVPVIAVVTDIAGNLIESAGHSLPDDQRVRVVAVPGTGTLPAGLSEDTTYWVVNSAADNFKLSATQGGAAIDITAVGNLMVIPLAPVTIAQNDAVQFAAGTLRVVK